jgi:hypothetical protein
MKLAVYPIKVIDYGSYGAVIGGLAMMVGSFGYGIFKRRIVKIHHFFQYNIHFNKNLILNRSYLDRNQKRKYWRENSSKHQY